MKNFLIGILVIIVLAGFYTFKTYNKLVGLDEGVNGAWAQVETQYQRRFDLIPNLVNTVKGYAEHEKETFESVTQARAQATQTKVDINDPASFAAFQESQGALSSALSRLMVVAEKYPDLKANQSFMALQSQLEGTENRIAVERKRFNDTAKEFNVVIRRFPANTIAGVFGFEKKNYFESAEGAEEAPQVEF